MGEETDSRLINRHPQAVSCLKSVGDGTQSRQHMAVFEEGHMDARAWGFSLTGQPQGFLVWRFAGLGESYSQTIPEVSRVP